MLEAKRIYVAKLPSGERWLCRVICAGERAASVDVINDRGEILKRAVLVDLEVVSFRGPLKVPAGDGANDGR